MGLSEDGEGLYLVERDIDGWCPCFFVQMQPQALHKFLSFLRDAYGTFRVKRVRYKKNKARFLFFRCGVMVPLKKELDKR